MEISPPRPAARVSILQSLVRALGPSAPDCGAADAPGIYDSEDEYDDDVDHGGDDSEYDETDEDEEEEEEDDGIDWEYLSSKTEGCQARDLTKLVKRCVESSRPEACTSCALFVCVVGQYSQEFRETCYSMHVAGSYLA